jgi:hypothetical protein
VALQPCCDARNSGRRYDKNAPTGSEHRHANRSAAWLEDRTAFGTPPQAQVKLDPGIDLAATQGAPGAFRARNYAERGGRSTVLGTYCDDKRTDSDGRCLKRNRLQVGTVNPQQCHIGGRIASDELRRHRVSAGKCNGELAILRQGFIGGDNEPWPPDEAARPRAVRLDSGDTGRRTCE